MSHMSIHAIAMSDLDEALITCSLAANIISLKRSLFFK